MFKKLKFPSNFVYKNLMGFCNYDNLNSRFQLVYHVAVLIDEI